MSDPFFKNVISLLHFDGADGGSAFNDQVPGRVWTPQGSVTTSSDFPLFGNTLKSVSGGYITCTHPSFAINTQPFTYELRVKLQTSFSYGYNRAFMQHGEEYLSSEVDINGFLLRIINHSKGYSSDLLSRWSSTIAGPANQFTPPSDYIHIAIVGDGINIRGYYEGVDYGGREAYSAFNSQTLRLGWGDILYGLTTPLIYIGESRFTIGVERYTSDFTPPLLPFSNSGSTGPLQPWKSLGSLIRNPIPALYTGDHRVYGTARLEAAPADSRRVVLLDRKSLRPIAATRSAADGSYSFNNIKPGTYLVTGIDRKTNYHPDIARVDSEPMP